MVHLLHFIRQKVRLKRCQSGLAKGSQPRLFQIIPVEEIESVERDKAFCIWMSNVDTSLTDRPQIEGTRIDELYDQHAKQIVVGQIMRREQLRDTAKQVAQSRYLGLRRMIRREELEKAFFHRVGDSFGQHFRMLRQMAADAMVLLVNDGVGGAIDEDFR